MKKVSVIIPCYNDVQFIEQAVDSAREQTFPDQEIIVIDDGSNMATKKVLQRLEPKIDLLIVQENSGVIKARNTGIEASSGTNILTLDSDDFFEPEFLTKAVKILDENPDVGMVTCWTRILNSQGNKLGVIKYSGAPAEEAIFCNNASGCSLFRKKCWKEVGGYDENLKNGDEDWEFNVSVTKKGWRVHVIEEELFNYRKTENSRHGNAAKFRRKTREYAFTKHKDLLIENFDKTLNFFLDEIESKEKSIQNLQKSKPYQIGTFLVKPMRLLKSTFRRKNK